MSVPTDLDDPLLAYRDQFPILERTNYLISNSLGAVPAATRESLLHYYDTWATRGVRAWEESWWTLAAELGDLVSPLIGAATAEVVFQPNVTLAHAVALSAIDFPKARPKIVTDAMHFPSILYLLEGQRSLGADVCIVPTDDGVAVDTQRLIDAIDDRTRVVAIAHVLFKSAYIHEVSAIAEKAWKVGALTIVDGYQSVGTIPVDVRALGVDIYIGGCLKWLCGGPGAAFLWVRPELRDELSPRLTGWMAHERPFGFEPELDRRRDAWRFLNGTPSIPALHAARPGLEIINEIGIEAIRAKSLRQTERLLALADQHGFRCTTPRDPRRRGGTVAFDVEHGYEISKALKASEILCDYRPGAGIRLSPHFYNRDDELKSAVAAILEIQGSEAWRAFAAARSTVT
jgi:kynureninase